MIPREKPKLTYSGLTVVLSNLSRFDKDKNKFLSAGGGRLFDKCIAPNFNRYQCDIRLREDTSPLLDGTKCVLLLGESAAHDWLKTDNKLGAIRGSFYNINGVPHVASFYPQDAVDIQDFEDKFNKQDGESIDEDYDDEDASDSDSKRRHGRTARRNYRFWLDRDIQKVKLVMEKGGIPSPLYVPKYVIHPSSSEVIRLLTETKGKQLFFDTETWYPSCYLKCFAFSFGIDAPIYCVPIYDASNTWAYSDIPSILRALAISFQQNEVVAHNGSGFDFLILAYLYQIGIGERVYDTMIAQHRIFSDVEKSLGHCISYWTFLPFHKDLGDVGYNTPAQVDQTLQYCGIDVYSMACVWHYQQQYAKRIPGLKESIEDGNAAIRPYMITQLQGFKIDEEAREKIIKENDMLCNHYLQFAEILIGKDNLKEIAGKSKSTLLSSPAQAVKYFHDMLGYPVIGYGNVRKDGSKGPSLGRKNILKLRLKVDNPVLDLIMAYRETLKETSKLKFKNYEWFDKKTNRQSSGPVSSTVRI